MVECKNAGSERGYRGGSVPPRPSAATRSCTAVRVHHEQQAAGACLTNS